MDSTNRRWKDNTAFRRGEGGSIQRDCNAARISKRCRMRLFDDLQTGGSTTASRTVTSTSLRPIAASTRPLRSQVQWPKFVLGGQLGAAEKLQTISSARTKEKTRSASGSNSFPEPQWQLKLAFRAIATSPSFCALHVGWVKHTRTEYTAPLQLWIGHSATMRN